MKRSSRHLVRNAVIAVTLAAGTLFLTPASAQALPPTGPGQSVTVTYFSDESRTVAVGAYSYGSCGTNFRWGTTSNWFSLRQVNCGVNQQ